MEKRPVPKNWSVSKLYLIMYDSFSIRYMSLNKMIIFIETTIELHNLNKVFD